MANEQNLIKNEDLTPTQRRENARKAGKASAAKKQERKKMRELLELALMACDEETGEKNNVVITAALVKKAKAGDTKAYEVIRDTIGEKPVDKVQNDLTLTQALVVFDKTPDVDDEDETVN